MTGMSFFGLFVIILILISFSIIIAEEVRRKEDNGCWVGINDTRNTINNISFYMFIRRFETNFYYYTRCFEDL